MPAGQQGNYSVLNIVSSTVHDFGGLCERRPDTCQQAYVAMKSLGAKIQYAGNALVDAIPKTANQNYQNPQYFKQSNFEKGDSAAENIDNSKTATTVEADFSSSQNTLKADDLNVDWQGPAQQDLGA